MVYATRSPGLRPVTPSPSFSTVPEASDPITAGKGSLYKPLR